MDKPEPLVQSEQIKSHSVTPPFLLGGEVEPPTTFSKRGLGKTSTFRGVTLFRGRGCNFYKKIYKLKSEIFNDKKSL